MTQYRRARIEGGCYFFTVALEDRRSSLLVDRVDLLRASFQQTLQRHPFAIDAIVILPDHLHCIWTLPEGDADYSNRWSRIKAMFSRGIEPGERRRQSRIRRQERGIWQRRFWEHAIRDERDFANHADYIHINPVKHGLVRRAVDWPHSSIHRYVKRGLCDPSWAAAPFVLEMPLG
jgi:putative transposase